MASNLSFVIDFSIKNTCIKANQGAFRSTGKGLGKAPYIPSATRHSIYEGRQSKAEWRRQQLKRQGICLTKPLNCSAASFGAVIGVCL